METKDAIKFLNSVSLIFMVLFLVFKMDAFLYIPMGIIAIILMSESISKIIASALIKIFLFVGTINSKILLTIIFYFVVTPTAFLFRLFNRKIVAYFNDNSLPSYFIDINKNYNKEFYENQW
jgi:energy-converting hydrogenase Eha subunit C